MRVNASYYVCPLLVVISLHGVRSEAQERQLSPPQYEAKPSCCLHFPTPKHIESRRRHAHTRSDSAEYSPYDPQSSISPVFDLRLFEKCPVKKDDETICAAVAEQFTKPHTSLYATTRAYGAEVTVDSLLTFIYDPHRIGKLGKLAALRKNSSKTTILPPVFANDLWRSDIDADIIAIGNGCCFNVYPNVLVGDQLSSVCHNKVLGPAEELAELFGYSIITAGNTLITGSAAVTIDRSVVMGGSWKSTSGAVEVAATGVTSAGPFAGVGLFVGGDVADGTDAITVTTGSTKLGGNNGGDRLASFTPVSPAQVAEAIEIISSRVCAVSQEIQLLTPSGSVTLLDTAGAITVTIVCEPKAEPCVVTMTTDVFNLDATFEFEAMSSKVIKINVVGGVTADFIGTVTTLDTVHAVWNFVEADFIRIRGTGFQNSIVAPRAKQLLIEGDLNGSVLVGHPRSHMAMQDGDITQPAVLASCPQPLPIVAVCECLCPDDKSRSH